MSIFQGLTSSFKAEVLLGVHDFRATGGDTFMIALYDSTADLNANTTAYTATGEVTGANYTAGGITLTNLGVTTGSTSTTSGVGFTSFSPVVFTNVTVAARGALIYNTTPSATDANNTLLVNPAVCVLDFGADKTATASDLTITFPTNTADDAIIRIA
jgi:hypothetical protein